MDLKRVLSSSTVTAGIGQERSARGLLLGEEVDEQVVYGLRRVGLDPMTRLGEAFDPQIFDPAIETFGERDRKRGVLFAPDQ